jgi:hypothetical protein
MAKTSIDDLTNAVSKAQDALNKNNPANSDGFTLPPTFTADGTGLPYSKVANNKPAQIKRNIISWFVPEFGIIKMFVNPNSIAYNHKKNITKERTKGGFTLQYWGEDLTTLTISGTTGSSGVEGINTLFEIYRAEQYGFDGTGLSLAANNASADLAGNLVSGVGNLAGSFLGGSGSPTAGAGGAGLLSGILGLDETNNSLAAKNIPSLAQMAFTVEMYYDGWVYRGFFEDMAVTERAENFLWDYVIHFTATQRRGYRTNYFPWTHSAKDGPSDSNSPLSFSGNVTSTPVSINATLKSK